MTAPSTTGLREAIHATNQKFMKAFADRDAAGMAALYTGNGQLLPPNSDVVTGAPAIQAFWQAIMDMGIKSATLETVEVEGHGESAHEVGNYTLYGDNRQMLDQGKYIVIWMREGGPWKLHRDIWNSSRPAG